MLPYDGVPEEDAHADEPASSSSSSSRRSNTATARATTSAWQWDAQWGLYFNGETNQWAKPLPDGSWEYADAVPVPVPAVRTTNDDLPPRKKKPRRRMDRDDPEQEDEKFDPFAVPEEQIWPGTDADDEDDEREATGGDPYANAPLLRLVVADPRPDPAVLPPAYKVASLDPGEPVSIGRDKSYERRIRLRELAVSKSHATLFWTVVGDEPDPEIQGEASEGGVGGYWAIMDNASTHGTFVRAEGEKRFVRLSEAKVASVPHRLYHLDSIRIGSTTFSVHIHPSFACSLCSVASDSSNLIPLVTSDTSKDKNDSSVFLTKTKEQKEQDRREQMAGLKAQFLKPNANVSGGKGAGTPARGGNGAVAAQAKDSVASESTVTPVAKTAFVDRAAARRHRDAGASVPLPSNRKLRIPGNSSAASAATSPFFTVPGATASATAAVSSSSSSAAPPPKPPVDPFASDSRGAQLLSKLAGGAHPADDYGGTNAGSRSPSSGQLGTLIEARTTLTGPGERRAGLGSKGLVVGVENVAAAASSSHNNGQGPAKGRTNGNWRDAGRERSWKRFREV